MKNKQIMNVATSLAFLAIAIVAFLGFTWLISTRGGMIVPGEGDKPLPMPTSTAFPWTENDPLTSADQIESILNDLADRNVAAIRQSDWVHIVRRDQSQPGMLRSSYSDSWFRYPSDDRPCAESLTWVKERPESGEFLQIIVEASDGTYGDLIQLRSGNGQVMHLPPDSGDCGLKPELTPAGLLASRLRVEQAASPDQDMAIQAWYAVVDGRPVFIVFATFTQPSKGNYTGITKEKYSFDPETGVVVQYGNRMEWEDGSVFSESLEGYETEFLPELPVDVAAQFEQYSAELKSYAAGTATRPAETSVPFDYTVVAGDTCGGIAAAFGVSVQSIVMTNHLSPSCIISEGQLLKIPYPTATPAPTQLSESSPGFVVYDQQFIPETDPLTDGGTILQILRDLKRRQIERLSEPGWYVYGLESPNPQNWMNNYYLLTHTLDRNGACEFMSYYIKDGRILPQQLVLADGRWGQIDVVGDGRVVMGETGQINWNNGSVTDTCQVQNTETVSFIQNETDTFQDIVNGKTQGTYKAWTEQIGGRKVFVLYYDVAVNGQGNIMDPDTRKLEPIERTQTWVYFDLDWGTVLYGAGWQVSHLQNGKIIGSAPKLDKTIPDGYTFYTELPADLKAAYEKAVTDLEAYLQK